jgi:predicted nucleic acid-binding protein
MNDVVIDTNVLKHASNPQEQLCSAARGLANRILDTAVKICVDEGFDVIPSKNRSLIGHEYLTHIRFGSFAYAFIVKLISDNRVRTLSKNVGTRASKIICQRVRKPADRVFIRIAVNSDEKVLVSHDFADFSQPKRDSFRQDLDVTIITALEALGRIP